jgi:hypothetical protein
MLSVSVSNHQGRAVALAVSIGAAFLMGLPDRASADDPTCDLVPGQGNGMTMVCQSNDENIDSVSAALKPGTEVSGVMAREPTVSCNSPPPFPNAPTLVQCDADPPVASGMSLHVDFATAALYEMNPDDSYFGCSEPCNDTSLNFGPSDFNGPNRMVTLPPAPTCAVDDKPPPCADLSALVPQVLDVHGRFGEDTGPVVPVPMPLLLAEQSAPAALGVRYEVKNFGPDTAERVDMTQGGDILPIGIGYCGATPAPDCNLGVGERAVGFDYYPVQEPGVIVVSITASSITRDPGPLPNTAEIEVEVSALPDSGTIRFTRRTGIVIARARSAQRARPRVTGRARNARAVYVAIARRKGGARVRGSAAECAWLRNPRGQFRRERARRCDEPVWLRARGRKFWRLALRGPLPPGSYTVLSRAVGASGVTEAAFSRRDGNRAEFRVRPR